MLWWSRQDVKKIQYLQQKAYITHWYGHTPRLDVKGTTKNYKILSNTLDTVKEMVTLRFHQNMNSYLGDIKDRAVLPMIGLCPTRWTVGSSCFAVMAHPRNTLPCG